MKINYFSNYLIIFLLLFISSCNSNDSELIVDTDKTSIEPDFFKNDGSENLEEEQLEEEAPTETSLKTYSAYNYTLLKPSNLSEDEICGDVRTMPLLVGSRKKQVGEVNVSNDKENLYLTFKADDYKYMKKVYLYIGEKVNIPFYSNGFPNLRKFNYKAFPYYYGGQKEATYVIPLSSIDLDCFEIVAYAKIFDKRSWCYYSSFTYDNDLTQKYYYSYYSGCYYFKDWVRSFEYCKHKCIQAQAYALWNDGGDLNNNTECIDNESGLTFVSKAAYGFLTSQNYFLVYLFTNTDGCDITDADKIGFIKVSLTNENTGELTIKQYFYNDAYKLEESKLYLGHNPTPSMSDYETITYSPATSYPDDYISSWPDKTKSLYISGKLKIVPSN